MRVKTQHKPVGKALCEGEGATQTSRQGTGGCREWGWFVLNEMRGSSFLTVEYISYKLAENESRAVVFCDVT